MNELLVDSKATRWHESGDVSITLVSAVATVNVRIADSNAPGGVSFLEEIDNSPLHWTRRFFNDKRTVSRLPSLRGCRLMLAFLLINYAKEWNGDG